MKTSSSVSEYLARIGRKGGAKSRRVLSSEDARNMVRVREARRAFRRFHALIRHRGCVHGAWPTVSPYRAQESGGA